MIFTHGVGGTEQMLNRPLVGWRNVVTPSNIAATNSADGFPVTKLGNPATFEFWMATGTGVNTLAISAVSGTVDYVGIAGHNFGSGGVAVRISSGATTLVPSQTPTDDSPLIFRFAPDTYTTIDIVLTPTSTIPRAAVVYVGQLLNLPRRIYVGHPVIRDNARVNIVNGYSDEGQFLGRIVLGEVHETSITMENIDPLIFRSELRPWLEDAKERPFFWAWRPWSYPEETAYVWSRGDSQMSNRLPNGMVGFSLDVQGIIG